MTHCPSCTRPLPPHHRACSRCGWTPAPVDPSLSPDQAAAFEALDGQRSVYLSGVAGTGKSFVLRKWIDHARDQRRRVAVTASTGIAASHVNGRTIHSWIGCGLGKETARQIFDDQRWAWRYRIAPRVRECQVLCIDEISLLDGRTFCLVSDLCKLARAGGWSSMARPMPGHEKPFGGLQLLLVGDMGQLPPVEEMAGFAFETDEWHEAGIQVIELTTVHRQEEVAFARVLREIRDGNLSPEGADMLRSRVNAFDPESPPATRLYSRNADVDRINHDRLEALPGPAFLFAAEEGGDQKALEQIEKACLSPRDLYLKVGAPVMFTRNHPDGPHVYVNGTTGIVTWMSDDPQGGMEVTTSTGQVLYPERHLWQSGVDGSDLWALEKPGDAAAHGRARRLVRRRDPGKGEAFRLQYPLRLAWAVTIHKIQGSTLDRVSIDISTCFAPGQAYVALSRARTLAGLNLERSFDPAVIRAHPTALRFLRGQYAPPEEVTRRIEESRRREEEQRALDERRRASQAQPPRRVLAAEVDEEDLPF